MQKIRSYVRSGATIAILMLRTKLNLIKLGYSKTFFIMHFPFAFSLYSSCGLFKKIFVDLISHKIKAPRRALRFIFHVCLSDISSRHTFPPLAWAACFIARRLLTFLCQTCILANESTRRCCIISCQGKHSLLRFSPSSNGIVFWCPSSKPNVNNIYFSIKRYFLWHIFNDTIKWKIIAVFCPIIILKSTVAMVTSLSG